MWRLLSFQVISDKLQKICSILIAVMFTRFFKETKPIATIIFSILLHFYSVNKIPRYMILIRYLISLVSFLLDKSKQHSPRCDATQRAVPSMAILFAKSNSLKNEIKIQSYTRCPLNRKCTHPMITMGESIRH